MYMKSLKLYLSLVSLIVCGILIMDSRVREPNVYTVDLLQAYTSLENLHETHNKLGAVFLSIYHLAIWQ